MVGTNVLGRAAERQSQRQYEMIERMNSLTDQMHTLLQSQDHIVQALLTVAESNREALVALVAKTNEIDAEVDTLTARDAQP